MSTDLLVEIVSAIMRRMDVVRVGGPEAECWVTLSEPADPFRYGYDYVDLKVTLEGPGLTASSYVRSAEGPAGLASFMQSLAAEWRGWSGVRRWEAIEHQLGIEARCDSRGHVALSLTLRDGWPGKPSSWSATVEIMVEAGAELGRLASDVAALLDVSTKG